MILVVTHSRDLTADFVIRHLQTSSTEYVRLDTDKLGTEAYHFGYSKEPELLIGDQCIIASDVSVVWARRFSMPDSIASIDPKYAAFVRGELATVMDAFLENCSGVQVNSFMADRLAGNRLIQTARARKVGFRVPKTLVTQNVDRARAFLKGGNVVTKALSFGRLSNSEVRSEVAFTSLVSSDADLSGARNCPLLLQEQIQNAFDWRVTTVGERVFAARMAHNVEDGPVDWRSAEHPKFSLATLPGELQRRLLSLCRLSNITFGAHDLIETPDGEFVFLETNPAGQWAWLELDLGLPIGEAVATELSRLMRREV